MAQNDQTTLFALLGKTNGEYTDEDLAELRRVSPSIANSATGYRDVASLRASIEVIAAIRNFDKASGLMIKRGNRINTWVLVFAAVAALLAGGALWISWLSYRLALAQ
jgi:hypothetical protein